MFLNLSALSGVGSAQFTWLMRALRNIRKTAPSPIDGRSRIRMEREVLRLAETSRHLLQDIGFEAQGPNAQSQGVRWRARQMPSLTLTETKPASLWDLTCGRG